MLERNGEQWALDAAASLLGSQNRDAVRANAAAAVVCADWIEILHRKQLNLGGLADRYPVTNEQFALFIDDDGYQDRRWWSDAGWAWREGEAATLPEYWHDSRFNAPNQPVVGVSCWEAEAFCSWAGGRLPTEQEWEAAARGTAGHAYPWGGEWEDGICNSFEAGLGQTSPVGLFPRSRQKELGIEDLVGNVWEWCNRAVDDDTDSGNVESRAIFIHRPSPV